MNRGTNLLPVMLSSPPLAAADGDDGGDDDDDDDDVAEGLREFMIRANGGICILLHMSLPNGRLHAEEMIIIEHEHTISAVPRTLPVFWLNHREEENKREGNRVAWQRDEERKHKGEGNKEANGGEGRKINEERMERKP